MADILRFAPSAPSRTTVGMTDRSDDGYGGDALLAIRTLCAWENVDDEDVEPDPGVVGIIAVAEALRRRDGAIDWRREFVRMGRGPRSLEPAELPGRYESRGRVAESMRVRPAPLHTGSLTRSPLRTKAEPRIASCAVPGDGGGVCSGGGPATGLDATAVAGAAGDTERSTWTAG